MKRLIALIALLVGLGVAQVATAFELLDDKTVRVTASYVEPTQNTDDSPINLDRVDVYCSIGDGPNGLGHIEPASAGKTWQENAASPLTTPLLV